MIINQQPPSSGGGGGGGATHTIYTTSSMYEYAFRKDGAWEDDATAVTRDAGEVVVIRTNVSSFSYRGRTSSEIHHADVFGNNGLANRSYYAMFVMPDEDITLS